MKKSKINNITDKQDNVETIKDTAHRKYMITINDPFQEDKGFTHEVINNILQTQFKSIQYYCFAEEKRS